MRPRSFRMPMLDQTQGLGLSFQEQPLTDEEQAQANLNAIEKEYKIQSQQALPEQMGPPGFLERLFNAGLEQPSFVPMSPVSGFLSGLAGGLAGRGQKVAQKRQQIENLIAQQRQQNQQQQLEDLKARRTAAFGELAAVRSERRRMTVEEKKQAATETTVSPEMVRANPGLAPLLSKNISNSTIAGSALRPPTPYVIMGPNGEPIIVPTGAAFGHQPPEPALKPKAPSSAERDQLVGDIGTLGQINDIRKAFRPELVGPVSGRVGAATQKAGVFKRPGESTLRSSLAGMRNQILKLRSGGAVSDGEAARLLEELPTTNDPSDSFMTKLDQFENTYRKIANARREIMSGTGIDLTKIPELPRQLSSAPVIVRAPNGKSYSFPSQEQADKFKQTAGIE